MASFNKLHTVLVLMVLIGITTATTYEMDNSIDCDFTTNWLYGNGDIDYVKATSTYSSSYSSCKITFYSSDSSYPSIKVESLSSYWSWPCYASGYSNADTQLRIHDGSTTYDSQLDSLDCYSSSSKSYVSSGSYLTFKLIRNGNSNVNFKFRVTATDENVLSIGAIAGIVVGISITIILIIAVTVVVCRRRRTLQHTTIVQGAPVAGGVNVVTSSTSQQQQQMGTGYAAQPVYPQQYPVPVQGYSGPQQAPYPTAAPVYQTQPPAYNPDTTKLI